MIECHDVAARRAKLLLPLLITLAGGCQTIGYYGQAISGQLEIVNHRRPIHDLIAATNTAPGLREKLRLVLELREFAGRQLQLPVDHHYELYADLHRRFVVWNVYAAPEFSVEPKSWWYPVAGRLKYRGYFSEPLARRYAGQLRDRGLDVYVGGVEAYSTLGWFNDPVLNTFIHHDECELAETLFHELAHQKLFIGGDTDFNEAFAEAVAEEGVRRWLAKTGDQRALEAYEDYSRRHEQFVRLALQARDQLKALYGDASAMTEAARQCIRQRKAEIFAGLRQAHESLKAGRTANNEYDSWFALPLNNAQLSTIATYYDLVPGFLALLQAHGGDLEKFYQEVRQLKKLPKAERHSRLKTSGEPR